MTIYPATDTPSLAVSHTITSMATEKARMRFIACANHFFLRSGLQKLTNTFFFFWLNSSDGKSGSEDTGERQKRQQKRRQSKSNGFQYCSAEETTMSSYCHSIHLYRVLWADDDDDTHTHIYSKHTCKCTWQSARGISRWPIRISLSFFDLWSQKITYVGTIHAFFTIFLLFWLRKQTYWYVTGINNDKLHAHVHRVIVEWMCTI